MTRDEAQNIIQNEKLQNYNWFNERPIRPEEVGIKEVNGKWAVYTADERVCKVSEVHYKLESDALEDFIERLRAGVILSKA